MANIAHKNDIGLTIRLEVLDDGTARDISGQTALLIYLTKPNKGDVLTKTGALTSDGTDGKLEDVTIANDLDTPGKWMAQGKVTEGATPIFYTTEAEFVVRETAA